MSFIVFQQSMKYILYNNVKLKNPVKVVSKNKVILQPFVVCMKILPRKHSSLVFVKCLMVRLQFGEHDFEVAQCSFSMQIQ